MDFDTSLSQLLDGPSLPDQVIFEGGDMNTWVGLMAAREQVVPRRKRSRSQLASQTYQYIVLGVFAFICVLLPPSSVCGSLHEEDYSGPTTRYYDFNVEIATFTTNCVSKNMPVVNGQFPGPEIHVFEGDNIVVNVTNKVNTTVTIHWHGIRQLLSGWEDGPGHITMCPLQPGDYYVYNFTITNQRGTLFWHAHVNWLRATVHGAFVVYPPNFVYPYVKPDLEYNVILGEWWSGDVEQIELQGLQGGGPFRLADALLINGKPGPLYNCSKTEGITTFKVKSGEKILLRVVNAALNTELFFGIANHKLTVVEADAEYTKPLEVEFIYLTPGQTINVLVTADQPSGTYHIFAKSHSNLLITDPAGIPAPALPFIKMDTPAIPSIAIFQYDDASTVDPSSTHFASPPEANATDAVLDFQNKLKTLHPELVPRKPDRKLFFTVGTSSLFCSPQQNCTFRASGEVNNITFSTPTRTSLLEAYYYNVSGVFTTDFPDYPPTPFDYTNPDSPPTPEQISEVGTRLSVLEFGSTVQVVLQDTMVFAFESHPFHLHGHSFYVVGRGSGNFDEVNSPKSFNTVDPPLRFTVDVPSRGWVAFWFRADNPGIWLFHCHLEKHASWGMQMAFLVKNGVGPQETLPPPPPRLVKCLT